MPQEFNLPKKFREKERKKRRRMPLISSLTDYFKPSCQFRSVSLGIAETFHTNLKNGTKRNKFHLILNLDPFRIFRSNSARNVPVSFHMFSSTLEKLLNQIEPCSI
jgi:hypothetical protein